jgi:8-oxo-dGTP diphosphatase
MRSPLRAGVVVGAAIFRHGRLLLLRRADADPDFPGLWDTPGGSVEVGESMEDAVRREAFEETGFRVRVGPPFDVRAIGIGGGDGGAGPPRTLIAVSYHCEVLSTRPPRLDPAEHSAFAWVRASDLDQYPVAHSYGDTLDRAFVTRPRRVGRSAGRRRPRRG